MGNHRAPAARAPIVTPQSRAKADIDYADTVSSEDARRKGVAALQHEVDTWKGLPSAMPVISPSMKPSEIVEAQHRINYLKGRPANAPIGPEPNDTSPSANAARAQEGAPAANNLPFRGSTPAEIKDFFDSDPINGTAAKTTAANVAAAAGTGNQVMTKYGPVSSTNVKNGPGATWEAQIAAKYPAIAIPGSQANKAFAAAYNTAIKQQGPNPDGSAGAPIDPHAIADQVMQNITNPTAGLATGIAANNAALNPALDIKAPSAIAPAPTVPFAGVQVPADQVSGVRSPEAVTAAESQQSGADARASVEKTAANIKNQVLNNPAPFGVPGANPIYDARAAYGAAKDTVTQKVLPFVKGLTGGGTAPSGSGAPPATAPLPSTAPVPETPNAPTPTVDAAAASQPTSALDAQKLTLGPIGADATSTPGDEYGSLPNGGKEAAPEAVAPTPPAAPVAPAAPPTPPSLAQQLTPLGPSTLQMPSTAASPGDALHRATSIQPGDALTAAVNIGGHDALTAAVTPDAFAKLGGDAANGVGNGVAGPNDAYGGLSQFASNPDEDEFKKKVVSQDSDSPA